MGTFKVNGDINITGAQTNINYGTPQYCNNQTNISTTTGLNICQGTNETSGIQLNGDYITMWSPADSYCLRYYDEDSGSEIWNINSSGLFSGTAAVANSVAWGNITSKPSTFTPSSHTHTNVTDGTMTVYGEVSNEVNFGGSNAASTIYFGYRAKDSKPIPTNFVFGGSSGSATITAANFTGTWQGKSPSAFATASHSHSYLPLSGGTLTGQLRVNATIFGYNYGNSNNAAAFIFDKPSSNYTGIGACGQNDMIHFGPCDANGSWVSSYNQIWRFQGGIYATGWLESDNYGTGDPGTGTAGYGRGGAIYFKVIG